MCKKSTFKPGDKIAGIEIKRVRPGTSNKVAIIGRSMGNSNMKGVKGVYRELKAQGYDVEIFDESSLMGDMLERYKAATEEFARKTNRWTQRLGNPEILKLDMYKLNKEWAHSIVEKGYTILDMGDMNNLGFSPFYAMEKAVIFR